MKISKIQTCGQIQQIPLEQIRGIFGEQAQYIWEMARGIDKEDVKKRYTTNSIGSGRNFMGVDSIVKRVQVSGFESSVNLPKYFVRIFKKIAS